MLPHVQPFAACTTHLDNRADDGAGQAGGLERRSPLPEDLVGILDTMK